MKKLLLVLALVGCGKAGGGADNSTQGDQGTSTDTETQKKPTILPPTETEQPASTPEGAVPKPEGLKIDTPIAVDSNAPVTLLETVTLPFRSFVTNRNPDPVYATFNDVCSDVATVLNGYHVELKKYSDGKYVYSMQDDDVTHILEITAPNQPDKTIGAVRCNATAGHGTFFETSRVFDVSMSTAGYKGTYLRLNICNRAVSSPAVAVCASYFMAEFY